MINENIKLKTLRLPKETAEWLKEVSGLRGMSQQSIIMMALSRLRVDIEKGEV